MKEKEEPGLAKQVQASSENSNPLARVESGDLGEERLSSNDLIYQTIMRNGGTPFGRPFNVGMTTLTERVVQYFKQKGFFRFETFENQTQRRNRFTRYGASPHRGEYDLARAQRAQKRLVQKKKNEKEGGKRWWKK